MYKKLKISPTKKTPKFVEKNDDFKKLENQIL